MSTATLPSVAGKLTANAPLAPLVWFKSGGAAEWLFEPKDLADLQAFLSDLDAAVPVMALGLGSNLIVRDGGVPGVVVRLGKAFATVSKSADWTLDCGAGASGILVSSTARDHGIAIDVEAGMGKVRADVDQLRGGCVIVVHGRSRILTIRPSP